MISPELSQLLDHMRWADAVVWEAALTTPDAEEDERLRLLFHHVHSVQWAYLHLFREQPVELPDLETFSQMSSIRRWGEEGHDELRALKTTLRPEDLDRTIDFPWAEQLMDTYDRVHPVDLRQGLVQLTSHSTYHRGQINARIRELGGEPPLVDYVVWLWAGRPDRS